MSEKHRIDWLDVARGYGILLVIFGHLWHLNIVYSFHLPLFFFISGYTHPAVTTSFNVYFIKKLKSIVVPYFSLGIVMILFSLLFMFLGGHYSFRAFMDLVLRFLMQERFWTIWFLSCLFFLNIIFYGIVFIAKDRMIFSAWIVFVLVSCMLYYYSVGGEAWVWNIDASIMALPFYYTGYYMKKFRMIDLLFRLQMQWKLCIFIVLAICNMLFLSLNIYATGDGLEMFASKYGFFPFTFISAIAGVVSVVLLSNFIKWSCIKYIGENSMIYFAWHQTIVLSLILMVYDCFGLFQLSSVQNKAISSMLSFILIVIIMTLINEGIKRCNLTIFTGLR